MHLWFSLEQYCSIEIIIVLLSIEFFIMLLCIVLFIVMFLIYFIDISTAFIVKVMKQDRTMEFK